MSPIRDRSLLQTSPADVENICGLPMEVWGHVFSFLNDSEDLASCLATCKVWRESQILQELYIEKSVGDVAVENLKILSRRSKLLVLRDVDKLYSILRLEAKIVPMKIHDNNFIVEKNPYYHSVSCGAFNDATLSCPTAKSGNHYFTIVNLIDIEIERLDTKEKKILKGEENLPVSHIVTEARYLFALRKDGIIVQWDYSTGEIVQKIETAFSKNDVNVEKVTRELKEQDIFRRRFCCLNMTVNEGKIALLHGCSAAVAFEVIDYRSPYYSIIPPMNKGTDDERITVNRRPFLHWSRHLLIKDNKLYLQGLNAVVVWDLAKRKEDRAIIFDFFQGEYNDFDVQGKTLCALQDSKLLVYDLESGQYMLLPMPYCHALVISGEHVLCSGIEFLKERGKWVHHIHVVNLKEKRIIETLNDAVDPTYQTLRRSAADRLVELYTEPDVGWSLYRYPYRLFLAAMSVYEYVRSYLLGDA
ncbi:MAG: F-box protein [Chlamydiia bacterium]|nr:F-box protein [Chlamydiia bacterium]